MEKPNCSMYDYMLEQNKKYMDYTALTFGNLKITYEELHQRIDEYVKLRENEKNKDREFIELFKRNYNEIVKFISLDPKHQIAVDCFTCLKGVDLSKQYGKPKRKE